LPLVTFTPLYVSSASETVSDPRNRAQAAAKGNIPAIHQAGKKHRNLGIKKTTREDAMAETVPVSMASEVTETKSAMDPKERFYRHFQVAVTGKEYLL
jgi:hypothetical protein